MSSTFDPLRQKRCWTEEQLNWCGSPNDKKNPKVFSQNVQEGEKTDLQQLLLLKLPENVYLVLERRVKCQLVVSKLLVVIFIFECFGELLSLLTVATLGGTNIYFWVALLLSDNTFHWLPPPLLFNYETCGNHFQELQYFEVLFCCAYFVPSLPGVLCVLSCEANLHIVCETEHRFNLNHWLKHGIPQDGCLVLSLPIYR